VREVEDAEGDPGHAAVGEDVVEPDRHEGHRLVHRERQRHRRLAQDLERPAQRLGVEGEAPNVVLPLVGRALGTVAADAVRAPLAAGHADRLLRPVDERLGAPRAGP
jgi:hypothetical protein